MEYIKTTNRCVVLKFSCVWSAPVGHNTALPGAYRQAGDDLASHSQAGRPSESNNKELGMMKSDRKGIAPLHVWLTDWLYFYFLLGGSGGAGGGSYKCSITPRVVCSLICFWLFCLDKVMRRSFNPPFNRRAFPDPAISHDDGSFSIFYVYHRSLRWHRWAASSGHRENGERKKKIKRSGRNQQEEPAAVWFQININSHL